MSVQRRGREHGGYRPGLGPQHRGIPQQPGAARPPARSPGHRREPGGRQRRLPAQRRHEQEPPGRVDDIDDAKRVVLLQQRSSKPLAHQ